VVLQCPKNLIQLKLYFTEVDSTCVIDEVIAWISIYDNHGLNFDTRFSNKLNHEFIWRDRHDFQLGCICRSRDIHINFIRVFYVKSLV